MSNENGYVLDWDDEISLDSEKSFVMLAEGEYTGTIVRIERGEYPGGAKLPECPKATVTVSVKTNDGTAFVKSDLLLYSTLQWKLATFARACGLGTSGKVSIPWGNLEGKSVRINVTVREYEYRGEKKRVNDISKWLEPSSGTPTKEDTSGDDDF